MAFALQSARMNGCSDTNPRITAHTPTTSACCQPNPTPAPSPSSMSSACFTLPSSVSVSSRVAPSFPVSSSCTTASVPVVSLLYTTTLPTLPLPPWKGQRRRISAPLSGKTARSLEGGTLLWSIWVSGRGPLGEVVSQACPLGATLNFLPLGRHAIDPVSSLLMVRGRQVHYNFCVQEPYTSRMDNNFGRDRCLLSPSPSVSVQF
mmetsp:Transcript_25503/g.30955  ORF Transcript_25503/g.30955 Transcript_25503/m.30955 type:complete len:205 (+) Transcript_25503:617-1231(+)